MAFIGIFVVAWLLVLILIAIGCILLFVYIPAVVIAIVGLVRGVKNHWPRSSIIMVSVSSPFVIVITTLLLMYLVWRIMNPTAPNYDVSSSSSAISAALTYLIY